MEECDEVDSVMIRMTKSFVKRYILLSCNKGLAIGNRALISKSRFGRFVNIANDVTITHAHIDDYSYIGPRCTIAFASVGRFCSIAPDVYIGSGSHPTRGVISSHPAFYLSQPSRGWSFVEEDSQSQFRETQIGHDVWLGTKVVIIDGVKVGNGSIVGAGSIVTKDVLPYGVYAGVPARLIRKRFSDNIIERLSRFQWWNKDYKWLKENAYLFTNSDEFVVKILSEGTH